MTEPNKSQDFAKCRSFSFQSWMIQWNCSYDVNEVAQVWRGNFSNYWHWNLLHVWFFLKHRFYHRSKRVEAIQLYHVSSGSWTKQVCNPLAQRRRHVSTCACMIELKTEFELEQAISMQLRNRTRVVRNVRIRHLSLLNARHKTQLFSV